MRAIGSRIALCFVAFCLAGAAVAQSPAIQYAEPVSIARNGGSAQFDAYGRRFSLTLADNDRLLRKLSAQRKSELGRYRLLRGSLEGAPQSWVRLTDYAGGVEGAIWDGHDLYTVTRYEKIAALLTTPLDAAPEQTVVYRLSDSRDLLPSDFCALSGGSALTGTSAKTSNGLDQYQAVMHELDAGLLTPALTRQIEISLIADSDFQAAEAPDPTGAMLARLNIVEGIFSEQLGLLVLATDVRLMPADSDPFTSTDGAKLLEQLSHYRSATPEVRARGLAHLMTGKDLDGTTAGIAYVRTVCDADRGASLSSRSYGTTISALIMAHELGHNFGAEHDGEPGTVCAAVGGGFIMSPSVTGYSTFSQCSIDTMQPVIASASCVTAAEFADVSIDGAGPAAGEGGLPFMLPFTVRSRGNVEADDAVLTVTMPNNAAFTIDSASSTLGSCSVSGVTATCTLGSMPVGASADIQVIARSSAAASFSVQARVSAGNDRITSNNDRQVAVSIRSGIDVAVAMSASAADIPAGSPFEIYADVSALRAQTVRGAMLSVNLNQPVTSASMVGGTCTVNVSSVSCLIGDLPSGATHRLVVRATAQSAGEVFASGNVSVTGDGDSGNNHANATAWVQAERDVEITAGSAGVDLGVGNVYEIPYLLRSRGPLPTADVTLAISIPSSAIVVDSLDAGPTACTHPDAVTWRCELGSLAPGATRAVRLRVHGALPVTGNVVATAETADDGYVANNIASVQLRIDHLIDLQVVLASGGSGIEDTTIPGQVSLRSSGRQAVTGATLDVALNAAGTLLEVAIHNGSACALVDEQHARCTLPSMARNAVLYVDYTARFADPGSYDVKFTASAPGDTAPANDALTRPILVRPYNDLAIAGDLDMPDLFSGQVREKTFRVTVDRRALASARLIASAAPGLAVASIRADTGECAVGADGGSCDFVNLPALGTVMVTVSYRAEEGSWATDPVVSVSTAGDVDSGNDSVSGHVETHGTTDLELRVAGAVEGIRQSALSFPLISVVNGGDTAFGARLEVTLPAEIALVSVSASNATCSGTNLLRCDFTNLDAGATATVALTVRASVSGSFVSSLKLTASNDTNVANDSHQVALTISSGDPAAAVSAPKGGGGRIEFSMLAALALLAGARLRPRLLGIGVRPHFLANGV